VLPKRIEKWSLTSLQQRLVKTGGRLIKHARYYWLLLAESHLTRHLFGSMVRRIEALPVPGGWGAAAKGNETGRRREGTERCRTNRLKMTQFLVLPYQEEAGLAPSWPAGVARDENDERRGSIGGGWVYNRRGQEAKKEILAKMEWSGVTV